MQAGQQMQISKWDGIYHRTYDPYVLGELGLFHSQKLLLVNQWKS